MNNFDQFLKAFNSVFESTYNFIEHTEATPDNIVWGGKLVHDGDEISYNSYGDENSYLNRIFQFSEFGDIYVRFTGTRRSYSGTEWNPTPVQVNPKRTETIIYE